MLSFDKVNLYVYTHTENGNGNTKCQNPSAPTH